MTQGPNVTLSLTEISTLKFDFLLETFQLPHFFKSPRENRFFRSRILFPDNKFSCSRTYITPLKVSAPHLSSQKSLRLRRGHIEAFHDGSCSLKFKRPNERTDLF